MKRWYGERPIIASPKNPSKDAEGNLSSTEDREQEELFQNLSPRVEEKGALDFMETRD
jgi:hypothetical protein